MAKTSGLGDNCYVGGYDLSGDIGALDTISAPMNPLEVTAINGSAYERIGGQRDGQLDFTAFHNTAANQEHARLSLLPTTDTLVTYAHGTTLNSPGACLMAKQINYDPTRGTDGALTFKVSAMGNAFGLEWGNQATAGKRSDTTATNGTGIDLGTDFATFTFGLQAYLQVFSFTGTSCTVKLQGSTDDGAGDAYADITGGSFGAQSAIGFSRIATANNLTIERYCRVVTTGTFSQCTFSVVVVVNRTATVF